MGDIVQLRTLTKKSVIPVGPYMNHRVEEIMECNKNAISWLYYCHQRITFTDDILDECHIYKRIQKPGVDKEAYEKRRWSMAKGLAEKGDPRYLHRLMNQKRKRKKKAFEEAESDELYSTSKSRLQWVNQGHK